MLGSIRSILCHPQQERIESLESENAELESQRDDAESKLDDAESKLDDLAAQLPPDPPEVETETVDFQHV